MSGVSAGQTLLVDWSFAWTDRQMHGWAIDRMVGVFFFFLFFFSGWLEVGRVGHMDRGMKGGGGGGLCGGQNIQRQILPAATHT